GGADRRATERRVSHLDRRVSDSAAAPPNAASDNRLELQSAYGTGAGAAALALCVRRWVDIGGCGGHRLWCSEGWRERRTDGIHRSWRSQRSIACTSAQRRDPGSAQPPRGAVADPL